MGRATCQNCGTLCEVQRPTEAFICPSCGKPTGGRGTGLETASRAGLMLVVFAVAALFLLVAVSGFLYG